MRMPSRSTDPYRSRHPLSNVEEVVTMICRPTVRSRKCWVSVAVVLSLSVATRSLADEDLTTLHICTQLSLPADKQEEAIKIADKVSPLNVARAATSKSMGLASPRLAVQIAALWQKKWQNGAEVTVGFLNGEPV